MGTFEHQANERLGLCCPNCGSGRNQVKDTRSAGTAIKRRRVCLSCQHRWTTFETTFMAVDLKSAIARMHEAEQVLAGLVRELGELLELAGVVEKAELYDRVKSVTGFDRISRIKNHKQTRNSQDDAA